MSVDLSIVTLVGYRVPDEHKDYVRDLYEDLYAEDKIPVDLVDDPICGQFRFLGQTISTGYDHEFEIEESECPHISPTGIAELIKENYPELDVTPSKIKLYTIPVLS